MIQQFLLTHCTYATSALEQKQGELANHPMGYSVRSASLTGEALRKKFHSLERYTYYYLPEGTPANDKEFLTADLAPKRLVYFPVSDSGTLLLHAAYRTHDTANRVGSYFAHALTADQPAAWSFSEALQTWGASGWELEDSDSQKHVIPPLDTLADILEGSQSLLTPRLFTAFLTTPDGIEIPNSTQVIPERWRKMPQEARCMLFRSVLAGFLSTRDQQDERFLLVAEPAMAALLFYGLSFFLPPKLLQGVSFSTFETQLDHLTTKLSATIFADTHKELDSRCYMDFFAVNTFTGRASELNSSLAAYLLQIWKEFQSGGLEATTRLCRHLDTVGAATTADLVALQHVDTICTQVLTPNDQLPDSYAKLPIASSRMAANYLKRRVLDALSKVDDPEKALSAFVGHPNHLLLLELAGTGSDNPKVQACLLYLLKELSETQLPIWIRNAPDAVPAELRAKILESWVLQNYHLPAGLDFLWDAAMSMVPTETPAKEVPAQQALVLPLMLAHLDMHLLDELFTANHKTLGSEYLVALAMGVDYWIRKKGIQDPEVVALRLKLDTLVQKTPLTVFLTLQRKYGNAFFRNYPGNAEKLGAQMVKLEGKIFTSTMETLPQLLRTLEAAVEVLPPAYAMQIRKWTNLKNAIQTVAQHQAVPAESRKSSVSQNELETDCKRMAECAFAVLNDTRVLFPNEGSSTVNPLSESLITPISDSVSPLERDEAEKRQVAILQTLTQDLVHTPLLPPEAQFQAYLWKNLKYCLREGKWHTSTAGRFGRHSQGFQSKKAKQQLIIVAMGGACLGLLVVFIVIFSLTFSKKDDKSDKTQVASTATTTTEGAQTAVETNSGTGVAGNPAAGSGKTTTTEEVPIDKTNDGKSGKGKNASAKEAGDTKDSAEEADAARKTNAAQSHDEQKTSPQPSSPVQAGKPFDSLPFEKTTPEVRIANDNALAALNNKKDHQMVTFAKFRPCAMKDNTENTTAPTDVLRSDMDLGGQTNGNLSERVQASADLIGGVLEVDGVLFPFGFAKGLPGGMEQPVKVGDVTVAPTSEAPKARKKHVLQADEVSSTAGGGTTMTKEETLTIPGRRYEVPILAEALGFDSVLVELRTEKEGAKYVYLQIARRCLSEKDKQVQAQHREQIKKLTDEVQSLKTSIDACELAPEQGGKAGETKPELFAQLAKLIHMDMPELQKPESKNYTEDAQYKRAVKAYEEKLQSQASLYTNALTKAKELLKNKEADLATLKAQVVPVSGQLSENEKQALKFLQSHVKMLTLMLQRAEGFENSGASPFAQDADAGADTNADTNASADETTNAGADEDTNTQGNDADISGDTDADSDEKAESGSDENADTDESADADADSKETGKAKKSAKARKANQDDAETPKESEDTSEDESQVIDESENDPFGDEAATPKAKTKTTKTNSARSSREKELPEGCRHLDVVVSWDDNTEMTATANRQIGKEKALLYVKVKPKEAKYKKLVEKFHIEAVVLQALADTSEQEIAPFEVGGKKSNYPKKIVSTTEKIAVYVRFSLLPDDAGKESDVSLPTFETDWFMLDSIQNRHRYTANFELPTECVDQLRACLERQPGSSNTGDTSKADSGKKSTGKATSGKSGKASKRRSGKQKQIIPMED